MDAQQGFKSGSGVVLRRRIAGEGDLLLTLFLKGIGVTAVSARGAAGGKVRFGGGTEPLAWGSFGLYKGKGGGFHLKSVDVADDMFRLRGRSAALFTAVRWAKLLTRYLMAGHPSDDLLANLYWNMKLLDEGNLPVEVVEWRFLWRWLKSWGLAPDLSLCTQCACTLDEALWTGEGLCCPKCVPERAAGSLSAVQLSFLRAVAEMKAPMLTEFIAKQCPCVDIRLFANAGRCLEGFLTEI